MTIDATEQIIKSDENLLIELDTIQKYFSDKHMKMWRDTIHKVINRITAEMQAVKNHVTPPREIDLKDNVIEDLEYKIKLLTKERDEALKIINLNLEISKQVQ